jgi:WD40 repeat protein/serine/threonine protein kinase
MNHCPTSEQLEQFLDERLGADEADVVSEHVSGCENCQAALEQITAEGDSELVSLSAPSLSALARPVDSSLAFLERLKKTSAANATVRAEPVRIPEIDGYVIREILGRGGMGVVYRAEQVGLNRTVALKMILAGPHASPRDQARFRQEAEAVARLSHPNIVQVFDVGASDGRPYFALEYVGGGSLARYLRGDPQAVPPTIWLVERLAHAVDFAHRHGVVHRDLKPANVLLKIEERPGAGDESTTERTAGGSSILDPKLARAEAVPSFLDSDRVTPKITDFGLAKRLGEQEGGTITGEVLGTPSYMAPEQASGKAQRVGPAADVYALGAILYEMLTGRPPFKGATPFDTVLQVLHEEPVRPASLRPGLARDLETICLKCLEKDPRKRYPQAADLADDLRRFRQGKPILARPVGKVERIWKWARRRPAYAALAAGIVLVTALGFAGVTWQWQEAAKARDVALEEKREKELQTQEAEAARGEAELARRKEADQRERARTSLYFSRIARSQLQWRVNDLTGAEETLNSCRPIVSLTDRRGWEWHYLNGLYHVELFALNHALSGEDGGVVFRPDGERIASIVGGAPRSDSEAASELRIWSARDGVVQRSTTLEGSWRRIAYRPNGKQLALASADGALIVIDAETSRERFRVRRHTDAILSVAYSSDGARIVTGSWDRTAEVCNAETGELQQKLKGHTGRVQSAAFQPDGRRVATGAWDGAVKLWDIRTGREVQEFLGHKGPVYSVAFSPDGTLLATAGSNGNLKIWDLAAGRAIQSLTGNAGAVLDMSFSPDGRYLAYGGGDGTVRVWDVESGVEGVIFRGHAAPVESVRFSPDGQRLVSSSPGDGSIKVWDFTRHPEYATFAHTRSDVEALAFHANGDDILSFTSGGRLQRWDATTGVMKEELALPAIGTPENPSGPAVFDRGGRYLAARARDDARTVLVWDTATGKERCALHGHMLPVTCLRFSPDGKRLATCASESRLDNAANEIKVWDVPEGVQVDSLQGQGAILCVSFRGDGKHLALAKKGGYVSVLNVGTREVLYNLSAHVGDTAAVAFSNDGRLLASAGVEDRSLKIWDMEALARGSRRALRSAAPTQIGGLVFSPDDKRLAAVSRDLVQIWDSATAQEVLTLRGATQRHWDPPFNPNLTFNADGSRLAASNWNESFSVWDADMPDDASKQPPYQARRRTAADQRATFWHLQEAQHCIEHKNKVAARFHLNQIEGKDLPPTLQTLKQRVGMALD